jgi:hypothetical protein
MIAYGAFGEEPPDAPRRQTIRKTPPARPRFMIYAFLLRATLRTVGSPAQPA